MRTQQRQQLLADDEPRFVRGQVEFHAAGGVDFKYANDVGGHKVGDQILVTVARSVAAQLRQGEKMIPRV